jgi:hypothetical protein
MQRKNNKNVKMKVNITNFRNFSSFKNKLLKQKYIEAFEVHYITKIKICDSIAQIFEEYNWIYTTVSVSY